ncbi:hypothetical protein [Saccharothrix deserti]|uniref:hypothetical protein n=1 Tax=Saccharothrix deserti TaxID=2593674 RepID=UPI00131DACE8|nr:hypothetical protein [Saccharothrix deserti]
MSRVSRRGGRASSRAVAPSGWKLSNGSKCQRCKRFGVYAPGQLACCTCLGWLSLIFAVVVLVVVLAVWSLPVGGVA